MTSTARHFRTFAEFGAHGTSPLYEEWALGVSADPVILELIDGLPAEKRIATLVFAAARAAGAPLDHWPVAREWMLAHWDAIREIALTHWTQTNEAARCATLLPVLASIEGPIALLEVGTSAGLCLHPDRYSYEYVTEQGVVTLDPVAGPSAVRLRSTIRGREPPSAMPEVVWRAGIDQHPLDVTDEADRTWLETLIWPEHQERRDRLRAAARIAASDPTRVVAGDLNDELPLLAAEAPGDATLVVFHSAVLLYLSRPEQERFMGTVRSLGCIWISNEAPEVLPEIDAQLPRPTSVRGQFILSVGGVPRALTGQHGESYTALAAAE